MSTVVQSKRRTCLVMSSFGFVVVLAAAPSLVRAEGNEMQMPMTPTPAAGSQDPATTTAPSGQGMGMMPPAMGSGMQAPRPGMTQPGMGGMQGQGTGMTQPGTGGMQGQGTGMTQPGMGGMQGQGMGMMGMMSMMGMGGGAGMGNGQGMEGHGGQMGGMQNGVNQPAVPGAPNGTPGQPAAVSASQDTRIYHVGAVDFFLDQAAKLNLTDKQTVDLTEVKRKALAQTSEQQTKIVQAEQELFALTGADSPNDSTIANKVKEIERIRTEQRLAFIKSVGRAGKVLTADQRKTFLTH